MKDVKRTTVGGIRYYSTELGLFPGVTSVLGCTPDPFMMKAINISDERLIDEKGLKKAINTRELAKKRGDWLHLQVQDYYNTGLIKPKKSLLKHYVPLLEGYKAAYFTELPVWSHTYGYAGTIDLVIADHEGKVWLVDIKTTGKKKTPSKMKDYFQQVAAYHYAFQESYGDRLELAGISIWVLYNKEMGKRKPVWFDEYCKSPEELQPDFESFLARLSVFKEATEYDF